MKKLFNDAMKFVIGERASARVSNNSGINADWHSLVGENDTEASFESIPVNGFFGDRTRDDNADAAGALL